MMGEDEILVEVQDLAQCGYRFIEPSELMVDRR